jgi:hypothetical protein
MQRGKTRPTCDTADEEIHGELTRALFQIGMRKVGKVVEFSHQVEHTYNEAKGEERATLDNMCRHISAVVTLAHHALISGDITAEGVFTAYKEEKHGLLALLLWPVRADEGRGVAVPKGDVSGAALARMNSV